MMELFVLINKKIVMQYECLILFHVLFITTSSENQSIQTTKKLCILLMS